MNCLCWILNIPGLYGVTTAVILFMVVLVLSYLNSDDYYDMEPGGDHESKAERKFPDIHAKYLDVFKTIVTLASGSIVLLIGTYALRSNMAATDLRAIASPLYLMALSIVSGVTFMIYLTLQYETYLHHKERQSYNGFNYSLTRALGFSSLSCLCLGYFWLIAVVVY